MNPYTVIIPSCTLGNVQACLESIKQHQPTASVVVVANGDLLGYSDAMSWDTAVFDWREPFNFSAVINEAVDHIDDDDDILLLNDDTRLLTPNGFFLLQQAAYRNPGCGLMFPAVTGCTGNPEQITRGTDGVRITKRHVVPFIGVYIRRSVWNCVGPMDPQYCIDYGVEDNDYCYRVAQAGYSLGIYDGCVIEHGVLPSAYRSQGPRPFTANAKLFEKKHGVSVFDLP